MCKVFIDSNIWIYALVDSGVEKEKRVAIINFLEMLRDDDIFVSTQVINEFHWILKRKYRIEDDIIKMNVENGILKLVQVLPQRLTDYKRAYKIRNSFKISFWDSLIIASALENGCNILYTEDMQHNQLIENKLKIINPFKKI